MKYVVIFCRAYFGLHCFASGLNYFVHFSQTGVMSDPLNAQFMAAIGAIGIYGIVKTIELVVGVLVLTGFFLPLALVLEFPISLMILMLSAHEGIPIHVFTAIKEVGLNAFLFAAYAGCYLKILTVRASPSPIWNMSPAEIGREMGIR